ncbi:NAD-dependent epimerase/dehydratase family protein [Treponema sp.]|uniref:NAD-dependent epimerase/dehydratase family protein n=1 Tax=Treponema sp. TaxID=166 RepID=UPI003FD6C45F
MKSLLFTGASGFLGHNIIDILYKNYVVDTLGRTTNNTYNINISTTIPNFYKKYDIVLHAAGKAHVVPNTKEEMKAFYDINLEGTKNLCKALESSGIPEAFIFISTVAVYGCEIGENIDETHSLEGNSPYADSKKQAEAFLQAWCKKNDVVLTILRPSLLAGKNPPGNLGSMIKGIKTGRYFSICGGKAKKSVAMAEDIARLIPICETNGGIFNLCDSHQPTFHELEVLISKQIGRSKLLNIPYWVAFFMAKIGDLLGMRAPINTYKLKKITKGLTFSNEKIKKELGFEPLDVLSNFKIQ